MLRVFYASCYESQHEQRKHLALGGLGLLGRKRKINRRLERLL